MASSGILLRVDLVRTDVSEGRMSSNIMVTRIAEVGITLAATSNLTLSMKKYYFFAACFGC
jgi:hypothetical protein